MKWPDLFGIWPNHPPVSDDRGGPPDQQYECPECCVAIDLDCDDMHDGTFACISCEWTGPLQDAAPFQTLEDAIAETNAAQIRRMTGGA